MYIGVNENNTLVWTSKEGGNVSLNTGEYNIRVELELFGKMIPLNNLGYIFFSC